jgi:hypothetical protein
MLQFKKDTITKSKNNLQDLDGLPKVDSSSKLASLPKVDSSSKLSSLQKVASLPRIKSYSDLFYQEDETPQSEVKKEIEQIEFESKLTLDDFNIPENVKGAYYFVQNFQDTTDPTKIQTLRKSLPSIPSYFNIGTHRGIDYFELIKDHIRNNRILNENHINYIKKYLNPQQKLEIIELYNRCFVSLLELLK